MLAISDRPVDIKPPDHRDHLDLVAKHAAPDVATLYVTEA
jgi:hypothetical protein